MLLLFTYSICNFSPGLDVISSHVTMHRTHMTVVQSDADMFLVVIVSKQTSIHRVFNSFSALAAFLAPFFLPSCWDLNALVSLCTNHVPKIQEWNLVVLHCSDGFGLNFRRYEAAVLLWFGTYKHPAAALYPELSCPAERQQQCFPFIVFLHQ